MTNLYVSDLAHVKNTLSDIDWSFSTSNLVGRSGISLLDVRRFHWYPASFIPEIPYTLIDVLTKPGAKIFDPFSGIGTTIFQSLLLGREPYGAEISNIAVKLIESYWNLLRVDIDKSQLMVFLDKIIKEYDPNVTYVVNENSSSASINSLRPWYNQKTFNELLFLILKENEFNNDASKSAYWISLSATLKTVCAQDRGFGCISDNMFPKDNEKRNQLGIKRDALLRFQNHFKLVITEFEKLKSKVPFFSKQLLNNANFFDHVYHQDITQLSIKEDELFDIVITSPPYPNMTDYSYSQRLSYYLLGQKPEDDVKREIGARRFRNNKNSLEQYDELMKQAISVITKKIKNGGYACFVLPYYSRDSNINNDRQEIIESLLIDISNNNLTKELEYFRILPERRRQLNQSWSPLLKKERIVIYKK